MIQIVTKTYKQFIELKLPIATSIYTTAIVHKLTSYSMIKEYAYEHPRSRPGPENGVAVIPENIAFWSNVNSATAALPIFIKINQLVSNSLKHLSYFWLHTNIDTKSPRQKYLALRPRFEYSFTQLVISTKQMALLGMKQAINNFWAWLRTHTIFVMRRGLKILQDPIASFKKRFFKYKKVGYIPPPERPLFKLLAKSKFARKKKKKKNKKKKIVIKLTDTEKSDIKILRKLKKTMKSQMRTYVSAVKQQIRNPKISLKKKTHKEKQLAGAQTKYLRQLNRLNQNKQAILQTAKKRKVEFKKRLPKIQWIQRLLRLDFLKKLASYFYFMRQSNTPPRLQLSNWDHGQRIKKYILHKPFYKKLKLNRVLQGIINKANRIVKQNRIPPKSFQRLKKRYKRNRRALFQKLAQILKRFVAPLKYPLRYRKTFNIAYNHLRKKIRIALLYLPIIAGEDLPKMREYNPTLEQRIGGRLPEVWFYMNIQALLHYISAHYHLYNPLSNIRTSEFTLNNRVNSIELKRIL